MGRTHWQPPAPRGHSVGALLLSGGGRRQLGQRTACLWPRAPCRPHIGIPAVLPPPFLLCRRRSRRLLGGCTAPPGSSTLTRRWHPSSCTRPWAWEACLCAWPRRSTASGGARGPQDSVQGSWPSCSTALGEARWLGRRTASGEARGLGRRTVWVRPVRLGRRVVVGVPPLRARAWWWGGLLSWLARGGGGASSPCSRQRVGRTWPPHSLLRWLALPCK